MGFFKSFFEGSPDSRMLKASRIGDINTVKQLLENGANVNAIDGNNLTALNIASEANHTDIVELLIEKGAELNKAMMLACMNGHIKTVRFLIDKHIDLNVKAVVSIAGGGRMSGITFLHGAAVKGFTDIVVLLLDKGADVNAKANDGTTALMVASQYRHAEVVELLKRYGALG